jgi:hypothetical protein
MTVPKKLTGLFLGAGASYEAGMPLVWDLTTELTRWLTPEKLRTLNGSWRSQGGRQPDEVIEDFASVIARPDLHYESMLGYLETQFRRHSSPSQQYHALYSWLVEMVSVEAATTDELRDAVKAEVADRGLRLRSVSFGPKNLVAYAEEPA